MMMALARRVLRIVMVENDDDDAFFILRALRKAGFGESVTRFRDGESVIDYFAQLEGEQPDVVLLDLKMPRRDGFDVLQWLRGNPAFGDLPVMILSSSDEPSDVRKAKAIGATQYLLKQSAFRNVIECMEKLLGRPGV